MMVPADGLQQVIRALFADEGAEPYDRVRRPGLFAVYAESVEGDRQEVLQIRLQLRTLLDLRRGEALNMRAIQILLLVDDAHVLERVVVAHRRVSLGRGVPGIVFKFHLLFWVGRVSD